MVEKLWLQVDELKMLVTGNPHLCLGGVQRAVGVVEEITMRLRRKELRKRAR